MTINDSNAGSQNRAGPEFNPYLAPAAPAAPTRSPNEPTAAPTTVMEIGEPGYWRDGGCLIAHDKARLPSRCIRCNGELERAPRRRTYLWHSPWVFVLMVAPVPLLTYLVVALNVGKRLTLTLGVCERHRRLHRARAIAWLMAAAVALVVAMNLDWGVWAFLLAIVTPSLCVARALTGLPLLKPVRIVPGAGRLRGCGAAFLATLPEYPQRPSD
jgi:hypothetical protein